jgi:hypothetical protein
MAPTSLVRGARELSKKINRVLAVLPPDDILQLESNPPPAASFLFEMVALHGLLVELKSRGWALEPVTSPDGKHRFPRAPAKKANHTWVRIERRGVAYQLVHGTQIADVYGELRAPDLSLQRHDAPDDPSVEDVVAIWDAKLKGKTGKPCNARLTDNEFRSFLSMVKWLDVPAPGDVKEEVLAVFPPAFQVRGLITNGQAPSEPEQLLLDEHVSVTAGFTDASVPCWPDRASHLGEAQVA